jgi:hypothetical protein
MNINDLELDEIDGIVDTIFEMVSMQDITENQSRNFSDYPSDLKIY